MQPWHRWREPLAVALLVALTLMLVLRVVGVGLTLATGDPVRFYGAIPGGDDLLLLAAASAVLWCSLPVAAGPDGPSPAPSPHAWPIALAGLVVIGLTVLGWLLLAGANVVVIATWPTPDMGFVLLVVEGLLRLAVPVAALVAVVLAVRRVAAARSAAVDTAALPAPAVELPAVTAAPDRLPAAWQADEATGAVWLTADDAAQGQPGLSWSDPAATAIAGAVASGPWAPPPAAAEEPAVRTPAPAPAAAEDDDLR